MGRGTLAYHAGHTLIEGPKLRLVRYATAAAVASAALAAAAVPAGAKMTAQGSIGQAYVLGAKKGQKLQLVDSHRKVVASGKADRFGSRIFLYQKPGKGYTVRAGGTSTK